MAKALSASTRRAFKGRGLANVSAAVETGDEARIIEKLSLYVWQFHS
jgi:hypothetical protein